MRYRFNHPDVDARRSVHSYVMLHLLDVRKLPAAGLPARMLPGTDSTGAHTEIKTWVRPLIGEAPTNAWGRKQKRSAHRVRCECPGCGVELSAGRLFQHECRGRIEQPSGKAWHVEVDGESPMPEAVA